MEIIFLSTGGTSTGTAVCGGLTIRQKLSVPEDLRYLPKRVVSEFFEKYDTVEMYTFDFGCPHISAQQHQLFTILVSNPRNTN